MSRKETMKIYMSGVVQVPMRHMRVGGSNLPLCTFRHVLGGTRLSAKFLDGLISHWIEHRGIGFKITNHETRPGRLHIQVHGNLKSYESSYMERFIGMGWRFDAEILKSSGIRIKRGKVRNLKGRPIPKPPMTESENIAILNAKLDKEIERCYRKLVPLRTVDGLERPIVRKGNAKQLSR